MCELEEIYQKVIWISAITTVFLVLHMIFNGVNQKYPFDFWASCGSVGLTLGVSLIYYEFKKGNNK